MNREEIIKLIKEELEVRVYTDIQPKSWDEGNTLEVEIELSIAGDTFHKDSDFVSID
jgi:hypothetical protein